MRYSLLVLCCFGLHAVQGQFTETPMNTVGKVGMSVTFKCSGQYLEWSEYITSRTTAQTIPVNNTVSNSSRYTVITSPSEAFHLNIKDLTLDDAGMYQCKVSTDAQYVKSVELIVFETDPMCRNNATNNVGVEGDYIHFSCAVRYKGQWGPVMRWRDETGEIQANYELQGDTVNVSFVMELMPWHNGHGYRCRTFFDRPVKGTLGANVADNFPLNNDAYRGECKLPKFTVYYGPRAFVLSPHDASYNVGTKIRVTADSNPPAQSYRWEDVKTNYTLEATDLLTITERMLGDQYLRVVACNTIPGPPPFKRCNHDAHKFTVVKRNELPLGFLIGGSVLFLAIFAATVTGFVILQKRRKKKRKEEERKEKLLKQRKKTKKEIACFVFFFRIFILPLDINNGVCCNCYMEPIGINHANVRVCVRSCV